MCRTRIQDGRSIADRSSLSRTRLSTCVFSLGQAAKIGQDARAVEESSEHNIAGHIAMAADNSRPRMVGLCPTVPDRLLALGRKASGLVLGESFH